LGETPAKPGLQFQRGFFIVPVAFRFVNEGGHQLSLELGSARGTNAKRLMTDDPRKLLQTVDLNANRCDFCLALMMAEAVKGSIDLLYEK
jgi:hypothetical protein